MKYSEEERNFRKEETIRISKLLRCYCRRANVMLKDVAVEMGITPNTFSKWYSGSAVASASAVRTVEDFIRARYPNLRAEDDVYSDILDAVGKYPTLNLDGFLKALQQHMESPYDYAANHSIGPSYFRYGVKGMDFAVTLTGGRVSGVKLQPNAAATTFLVRANSTVKDGQLVLAVKTADDSVHCARMYKAPGEELSFKSPVSLVEMFTAPYFSSMLLGVCAVIQISSQDLAFALE